VIPFEILASGYGLVEGPTEDPSGRIVFSDVLGGGVYRVDDSGAVTTVVPKRRGVGGIALHAMAAWSARAATSSTCATA
jgi:gluconolactonase